MQGERVNGGRGLEFVHKEKLSRRRRGETKSCLYLFVYTFFVYLSACDRTGQDRTMFKLLFLHAGVWIQSYKIVSAKCELHMIVDDISTYPMK